MLIKATILSLISLLLLLNACATSGDTAKMHALHEKYDAHCREHAEKNVDSPDVESLYRECMDYFVRTDIECPYYVEGSPQ